MSKKTLILTLGSVVIILTFCLYWRNSTFSPGVPDVKESNSVSQSADKGSTLAPSPLSTAEISDTIPPVAAPIAAETATDTEEIAKAIDFLDNLEEQGPAEEASAQVEQAESLEGFNQDEMFQLLREGVSYYDSLLVSGSATFFIESWSRAYPNEPRGPSGTWEGTFEFSGRRVRGTVREDVTSYEADGRITHRQNTSEFAYDGQTYETLRQTPQGMQLDRQNEFYAQPDLDPRFWGWNLSGREEFAEMIDTLEIQRIEFLRGNGTDVYYVKGESHSVEVELWINPEASFRPERYSFATKGDTTEFRITHEYSFSEVVPDLWFPESGSTVTTLTDLATGVETEIYGKTFRASNVRLNESVPLSRFAISPPPGTHVADKQTQTRYTIDTEMR